MEGCTANCLWTTNFSFLIHFGLYVLVLGSSRLLGCDAEISRQNSSDLCCALILQFPDTIQSLLWVRLFGFSVWGLLPLKVAWLHYFPFKIPGKRVLHRLSKRFEFPTLEWNNNELQMLKMVITKSLLDFFSFSVTFWKWWCTFSKIQTHKLVAARIPAAGKEDSLILCGVSFTYYWLFLFFFFFF